MIDRNNDPQQRTKQQNKAGHLWFQHIADSFNDHGLDMQVVLAKRAEIRWTPEAVKNLLFKGLAQAMYQKTSTTELSTKEFTAVAEMLRDLIAKDYGVDVDFPNIEAVLLERRG